MTVAPKLQIINWQR